MEAHCNDLFVIDILASPGSTSALTTESADSGNMPLGNKLINIIATSVYHNYALIKGIEDLYDVTTALNDVANRWKYIGLALRLHNPDLNKIEAGGKSVTDCLTDMLEQWLNQNYDVGKHGKPSWQMLEDAVRAKAGGNNPALAEKIYEMYN